MTYMLLFWGGVGFCLYFWGVMMFLFWHICAASACKHEPFWLYSSFLPVTAGGTACRDAASCSLSRAWGNTVLLLLFWVLFWDLTIVYLFENKICDSYDFSTCLLFCFKSARFARLMGWSKCQGGALGTLLLGELCSGKKKKKNGTKTKLNAHRIIPPSQNIWRLNHNRWATV